LSQPITAAVGSIGDKEWYKITPTQTGLWVLTASKPASNAVSDSIGTLYQANGTTVVASDDDSAGNFQFKVQAQLVAGQTYFLEVKGYGVATGNVTVTATAPNGL